MEKQVFGIVVPSNDSSSESEHTHDMYLVSWDGRQLHVHNFSGVTSLDVGHRHTYVGTTAPAQWGPTYACISNYYFF